MGKGTYLGLAALLAAAPLEAQTRRTDCAILAPVYDSLARTAPYTFTATGALSVANGRRTLLDTRFDEGVRSAQRLADTSSAEGGWFVSLDGSKWYSMLFKQRQGTLLDYSVPLADLVQAIERDNVLRMYHIHPHENAVLNKSLVKIMHEADSIGIPLQETQIRTALQGYYALPSGADMGTVLAARLLLGCSERTVPLEAVVVSDVAIAGYDITPAILAEARSEIIHGTTTPPANILNEAYENRRKAIFEGLLPRMVGEGWTSLRVATELAARLTAAGYPVKISERFK